ncbi:hypothetical protein D3C74_131500 [compost metagenome]
MSTIHEVMAVMPDTRYGLTGIERIKQNIRIIATMVQGQVTLDRNLGIDPEILDRPQNYVRLILPGALISAIEDAEPGVQVTEVLFADRSHDTPDEFGRDVAVIRFVERSEV